MSDFNFTLAIIGITCLISYGAFNNRELLYRLIHNPYTTKHQKEYHRLLTSGFIHGSWMHLGVNMFVLWSFGSLLESYFVATSVTGVGILTYLLFYLIALVVSSLPSQIRYNEAPHYNSLGASGAVSAVIFATIILEPIQGGIMFIFLPFFSIPPIIFGVLYLLYESYAARKGGGNINHAAHLWGAIFGAVGMIILRPSLLPRFFNEISGALGM